jgi:hypothetical protein
MSNSITSKTSGDASVDALLFPSFLIGANDLVRQLATELPHLDCTDKVRAEVQEAIQHVLVALREVLSRRIGIVATTADQYGLAAARLEQEGLNLVYDPLMMISAFVANTPRKVLQ